VVIENNGTLDELRAAVDVVWRERLTVRARGSSPEK